MPPLLTLLLASTSAGGTSGARSRLRDAEGAPGLTARGGTEIAAGRQLLAFMARSRDQARRAYERRGWEWKEPGHG